MVTVAVDEGTVGHRPLRRTLVLAFLLGHEGLLEHPAIELLVHDRLDPEGTLFGIDEVAVDHDYVEDAPDSLIGERTEPGLDHRKERIEEILRSDLVCILLSMKVGDHALVERIVIHVTHHDNLDSRIFIHELHGVLIDNLRSAAPEVSALASDPGRKVGYIESEHLIIDGTTDFKDVPRPEISLLLRSHGELYRLGIESERNGPAPQEGELVRTVKQCTVDTAPVRSVIVDYLEIGIRNLGLDHQLFENVAVFDLADAQDGVVNLILLLHGADNLGHVVEFLAVLDLGPLVGSVGKILVVVLAFVVIGVKQVLKVVETDHVALLDLLGSRKRDQDEKGEKYAEKSLHN
ncbi:MAG: hypothetical protein J6N46_00670 [Bacteroidales bacterium]|nr:hypothetical protein [Bacteroidales bacterium]